MFFLNEYDLTLLRHKAWALEDNDERRTMEALIDAYGKPNETDIEHAKGYEQGHDAAMLDVRIRLRDCRVRADGADNIPTSSPLTRKLSELVTRLETDLAASLYLTPMEATHARAAVQRMYVAMREELVRAGEEVDAAMPLAKLHGAQVGGTVPRER